MLWTFDMSLNTLGAVFINTLGGITGKGTFRAGKICNAASSLTNF